MRSTTAIIGFILLTIGCWFAWQPLAAIVAGTVLLSASIYGHIREQKRISK